MWHSDRLELSSSSLRLQGLKPPGPFSSQYYNPEISLIGILASLFYCLVFLLIFLLLYTSQYLLFISSHLMLHNHLNWSSLTQLFFSFPYVRRGFSSFSTRLNSLAMCSCQTIKSNNLILNPKTHTAELISSQIWQCHVSQTRHIRSLHRHYSVATALFAFAESTASRCERLNIAHRTL